MKKLISIIIVSSIIFSCASGLLIQSVFAASSTLPTISGTTRIDHVSTDGITGDMVVITNTGTSSQSTGDLNNIVPSNSLFSLPPEEETSGKIDFAMPVVPITDAFMPPPSLYSTPPEPCAVGDKKIFELVDLYNTSLSTTEEFTAMSIGTNCIIWVMNDPSYTVDSAMAQSVTTEFDLTYPTLKSNFGEYLNIDSTGKVNVLMYDILDGNNPASFVGGFFWSGDFYNTNKSQMIHIDTYPSIYRSANTNPHVSNAYSTVVHEMQHLINYSNSYRKGITAMDSWLNEALSMAAEEMLYPNNTIPSRLVTYNSDSTRAIANGKSVLEFDNTLSSYALSCLFSAYLNAQTDSAVFSRIIENFRGKADDAITEALVGTSLVGLSFSDVLSAYRTALARNDTYGIYGFNGKTELANIRKHIYSGGSMMLPPGGSITVKPLSGTFTPSNHGSDVNFIGISEYTEMPIITNKPKDMIIGETHTLTALGDQPATFTWSSSDETIATIDSAGTITALAIGTTTITLTNDKGSDSFELTVTDDNTITIEPFPTTIMVGATTKLTARTRPATGTAAWSSSVPAIAAIDGAGNLTGVSVGNATITATFGTATATAAVTVVASSGYPGLEVDVAKKEINVVADVGMSTLSTIVSSGNPAFDVGLAGWTINQKVPVTLINHVPIGTGAASYPYFNPTAPFKGTYNGNNQSITFESASTVSEKYIGIFGVNCGTINDINVTVTNSIGNIATSMFVGSVVGYNMGTVNNSTVCITENGKIIGIAAGGANPGGVGGVVGFNQAIIYNSSVTNYGLIKSYNSLSGGVTGHNRGGLPRPYAQVAIVNTATVYNAGSIECKDDLGGVVGLNDDYGSYVTGNLDVTIAKGGQIRCEPSADSASVGGVIGLNYGYMGRMDGSSTMHINLRIDGNISTVQGTSGGVIGQSDFNVANLLIPTVSVTLGPDSEITNNAAGRSGLIMSYDSDDSNDKNKYVYAVPYGSPYHAFPTSVPKDQGVKRIEYPKSGNPSNTIKILDPDQSLPTNVINGSSAAAPNGIFIKKDALITPPLIMESAFDDEIFDINTVNQTVQSKYLTEKNYYDFNMVAGGIPIVVPAYLDVKGKLAPPAMTLNITGDKVFALEDEATADPGYGKKDITIAAKNGRITDWDITKDGIPYKSSVTMSKNTDLLKQFSTSERGLYVITATGTPLGTGDTVTLTKYLRIGGIPAITVDGQHLTGLPSEVWTNLKDTLSGKQIETATSEAHATDIETLLVTKGAIPYVLHNDDFEQNGSAKKIFSLSESGQYVISAKGKNLIKPAVKYVNIDIDIPSPPIIGDILPTDTEIPITMPLESLNQSPTHAEYKVDDGTYVKVIGTTIPISGNKLTLRTVDLAGNISDEIVVDMFEVTVQAEPANGGTVTGGGTFVKIGKSVGGITEYDADVYATIEATAASGYAFERWSDGINEQNTPKYVFKVNGDADFVAHFTVAQTPTPPPTSSESTDLLPWPSGDYIKLEYLSEAGGSIHGIPEQWIVRYTDGAEVEAIPKQGYRFVTWSDGVKTPKRKDLKVPTDLKVTALFELIEIEKPAPPPIINNIKPPKTGSTNWTPILLAIMGMSLGAMIFSAIKLSCYKRKLLTV